MAGGGHRLTRDRPPSADVDPARGLPLAEPSRSSGASGAAIAGASTRWIGAGVAAAASLLHWAGADTMSHEVSARTVAVVLGGGVEMLLAVALATAPWMALSSAGARRAAAQMILAVGAGAIAILLLWTVVIHLGAPDSAGGGHAGHDPQEAANLAPGDATDLLAGAADVALIGVLLAMLRGTRAPRSARGESASG